MVMEPKRQDAPDELEHVRAFVNTRDLEEGTDELGSAAALTAWLADRDLIAAGARATRADLRQAIELREALRSVLLAHTDHSELPAAVFEALDDAACRARLQLRFDAHGMATLEPEAPGPAGALGRLLAIVHDADARGTWMRLKACRDPNCAWAFYDHTKNRSGSWCTMDVCGNRSKARAFRSRHVASETGAE
jgi:predicted RNA-binding Zn ribbon-like protein